MEIARAYIDRCRRRSFLVESPNIGSTIWRIADLWILLLNFGYWFFLFFFFSLSHTYSIFKETIRATEKNSERSNNVTLLYNEFNKQLKTQVRKTFFLCIPQVQLSSSSNTQFENTSFLSRSIHFNHYSQCVPDCIRTNHIFKIANDLIDDGFQMRI